MIGRLLEKQRDARAEALPGRWLWNVWLRWVGYTTLGYGLRGLIGAATQMRGPDLALGLMVGALSLGVVALLQWLILRRYLIGLGWWSWVLATLMGQLVAAIIVPLGAAGSLALGSRVVEFTGETGLRLLANVVVGGLYGAGVGFAQWLLLRRYLVAAFWWIPAAFLAGAAVNVLTSAIQASSLGMVETSPITQVISGVMVGSITGMTLVWLLRKPQVRS